MQRLRTAGARGAEHHRRADRRDPLGDAAINIFQRRSGADRAVEQGERSGPDQTLLEFPRAGPQA